MFDEQGKDLGLVVYLREGDHVIVQHFANTEATFVFGGVSSLPDTLLQQLRAQIDEALAERAQGREQGPHQP